MWDLNFNFRNNWIVPRKLYLCKSTKIMQLITVYYLQMDLKCVQN